MVFGREMVAKSKAQGHEIIWDVGKRSWVYSDTNEPVDILRPCLHCNRETVNVLVKIPADLSFNSKEHWKEAPIDACLAPIVEALQKAGIDMRGSCCGHGRGEGDIHLQDGRALIIFNPDQTNKYYIER